MADKRFHVVTDNSNPKEPIELLVKASSKTRALKHVTGEPRFTVDIATPADVARILQVPGAKIHEAAEDE